MCNVCCKEFKGWCKSFTKTEIALAILQAVLLVIFIAFLTFLILHLIACLNGEKFSDIEAPKLVSTTPKAISVIGKPSTQHPLSSNVTLDPAIECTWKPSEKTIAEERYYESDQVTTAVPMLVPTISKIQNTVNEPLPKYVDGGIEANTSILTSGSNVDYVNKGFLIALVKLKLPQDVTFGCVLTIISEYWTLTSASCIEAIEEVDAVDSFVMMEGYVENNIGKTHTLSDVLIHPEYHGVNKKYDVAALKSEDHLINKGQNVVQLPTMLDALVLTIGEQLSLLGYEGFRLGVREVVVHTLAGAQCAGSWAPRHLAGGAAVAGGGCGAAPLCVGAPGARGGRCARVRCAGAPLLLGGVVLGVAGAACGAEPCAPAAGASAAAAADWLRSVLAGIHGLHSLHGDE